MSGPFPIQHGHTLSTLSSGCRILASCLVFALVFVRWGSEMRLESRLINHFPRLANKASFQLASLLAPPFRASTISEQSTAWLLTTYMSAQSQKIFSCDCALPPVLTSINLQSGGWRSQATAFGESLERIITPADVSFSSESLIKRISARAM